MSIGVCSPTTKEEVIDYLFNILNNHKENSTLNIHINTKDKLTNKSKDEYIELVMIDDVIKVYNGIQITLNHNQVLIIITIINIISIEFQALKNSFSICSNYNEEDIRYDIDIIHSLLK